MPLEKIKVAIIGAGEIAKSAHIPTYRRNPNAEIVAIVDKNINQLKKVAKKFKINTAFTSVDELLDAEKIDAMSICTPPETHAEIAIRGLKKGVHILCEKPLSVDVEEAKKMVTAAKNAKRILTVGFHRRFIPSYQKARKQISSGCLGHVYCIEDHFVEPNPLYTYTKSTWFFKTRVGGVVFDIAPHIFDMLNYLFDDFPIAISARGTTYLDQSVEDCGVFIIEYPDAKTGIGTASWLAPKVTDTINIFGTAQNMFVTPNFFMKESSNEFREIAMFRAACESLLSMKFPNLPITNIKKADPYQLEIDQFIQNIKNDQSCPESALNGLSVVMIAAAAKKSIEQGCRIEIPHPRQLL